MFNAGWLSRQAVAYLKVFGSDLYRVHPCVVNTTHFPQRGSRAASCACPPDSRCRWLQDTSKRKLAIF